LDSKFCLGHGHLKFVAPFFLPEIALFIVQSSLKFDFQMMQSWQRYLFYQQQDLGKSKVDLPASLNCSMMAQ
jgi:hypothetical protein